MARTSQHRHRNSLPQARRERARRRRRNVNVRRAMRVIALGFEVETIGT
jgi:hypothetical protein